ATTRSSPAPGGCSEAPGPPRTSRAKPSRMPSPPGSGTVARAPRTGFAPASSASISTRAPDRSRLRGAPVRREALTPVAVGGAQLVEVVKRLARPDGHARERRVGHENGHPGLGRDEVREPPNQRAATSQQDPVAGDVAGELRRG